MTHNKPMNLHMRRSLFSAYHPPAADPPGIDFEAPAKTEWTVPFLLSLGPTMAENGVIPRHVADFGPCYQLDGIASELAAVEKTEDFRAAVKRGDLRAGSEPWLEGGFVSDRDGTSSVTAWLHARAIAAGKPRRYILIRYPLTP